MYISCGESEMLYAREKLSLESPSLVGIVTVAFLNDKDCDATRYELRDSYQLREIYHRSQHLPTIPLPVS